MPYPSVPSRSGTADGIGRVLLSTAVFAVMFLAAGCGEYSTPPVVSNPKPPPVVSTAVKEPSEAELRAEELARDRETIVNDIKKLVRKKDFAGAFERARPFVITGDPTILRLSETAEKKLILQELRTLPAAEVERNRDLYARLVELEPGNEKYVAKRDRYAKKAAFLQKKREAKLELEIWRTERQRYYFAVKGRVRNKTTLPLQGITVVIDFKQSNGVLLARRNIPVEPNLFPSGATFDFETKVLIKPTMHTAVITFKDERGRPVPWYREEN